MTRTSDTRITGYEPLLSPSALLDQLPLDDAATAIVEQSRAGVRAVLDGSDDRLLVIAGPCSVHDPAAALDYAGQLIGARELHRADLLIVMRVYFEKPRTVTGWKGLINDPDMDGGHDVHRGLHNARRLLRDIVASGLPVGCEWLDPITPQYIADTVTWGAIGARTTESQVHRQVAAAIAEQVAAGERGLTGVMLESFLVEGKQEPGPPATLTYGQSVTDACMDFGTTAAVLAELAGAVRTRRRAAG